MSVRVSLRGMLRLIRVDTLRRAHNVGFLAGRLIIIILICPRLFLIFVIYSNSYHNNYVSYLQLRWRAYDKGHTDLNGHLPRQNVSFTKFLYDFLSDNDM